MMCTVLTVTKEAKMEGEVQTSEWLEMATESSDIQKWEVKPATSINI